INIPWDNPNNPDGTLKIGTEPGWIGRENINFLHDWQYNFSDTKQANISADVNLIYEISPRISLSTFNRVNYDNSKGLLYYDVRSKQGSVTSGRLSNSFSNSTGLITSNRLEYNNNFGNH